MIWALMGSRSVRIVGACFITVGAYAWWEARTEKKGAERALVKVETKANNDAQVSNEVRTDVAAGRRGKPDPYRLRP